MLTVRSDFPYLSAHPGLTYLDTAATSQKPKAVIDSMNAYYTEYCANVHRGAYTLAERATESWEQARRKVASFLNAASEREIIFTRGATEGFNLLATLLLRNLCNRGDRIIVSSMEHHSNLLPWQVHAEASGVAVDLLDYTAEGLFDLEHLSRIASDKTRLIAVTGCSNVFGLATQLEAVAAIARRIGALVIVDAVQLGLHRPIDVQKLNCDFLVISGHKLLGPTGIGAVWGRAELLDQLPPWHFGGEMVEDVTLDSFRPRSYPWKFEAGTPPIAEAIGLGAALNYITELNSAARAAHSRELAKRTFEILAEYPEIEVYGSTDSKLRFGPIIFNLKGVHPHDLVAVFNSQGVAVRAGGHCAHPVMQKLGVTGTARISFGPYNEPAELEAVDSAIKHALKIFKRRK